MIFCAKTSEKGWQFLRYKYFFIFRAFLVDKTVFNCMGESQIFLLAVSNFSEYQSEKKNQAKSSDDEIIDDFLRQWLKIFS